MADFFSVLGKKISDVAEDLGKKTEETVEVQKIKSNIRSLKRANERDFIDIGKMVYDKFHEGAISDTDCIVLCEAIEKREEEIVRQQEEVNKIKGTV